MKNRYTTKKIDADIQNFSDEEYWGNVRAARINYYQWADNGYNPDVEIRVMYSDRYIYVFFKVYEEKVRIKHTKYASDVWKDSCVEFFINPFPRKSDDYINIEINAVGAMLIAKGNNRNNRKIFSEQDVESFEIISSIKKPLDGIYGGAYWTLHYKIPIAFFEKSYNEKFTGGSCSANFYKCGDETEYPHYGMWNKIELDNADFHVPQFFGELVFE